jgi:hypothetical protein
MSTAPKLPRRLRREATMPARIVVLNRLPWRERLRHALRVRVPAMHDIEWMALASVALVLLLLIAAGLLR